MNSFGQLKWEFEPLSTSTIFLDLHITLVPTGLHSPLISTTSCTTPSPLITKFKTHQKPLNLYLYIPPHSAHPHQVHYEVLCMVCYKNTGFKIQRLQISNILPNYFFNGSATEDMIHSIFFHTFSPCSSVNRL